MRTRAQALEEVAAAATAVTSRTRGPSPSPQGLIDRIKLKISSNGRYGTRSQALKEQQQQQQQQERDVKIVLKRKPSPHPEETALVIKKHKRGGIQSQNQSQTQSQSRRRQPQRRGHDRDKGGEVEEEEDDEEEDEGKEETKEDDEEEEEEEEDGEEDDRRRPQHQQSRKNKSKVKTTRVGNARSRRPTPATEKNASPSREDRDDTQRQKKENDERKGGGEVTKEMAKGICTVNTDMAADRSEASISSEPSCSFDSKGSRKRSAGDEALPAATATRTPLFVPAKRSPLPFPLPPPAAPPPVTPPPFPAAPPPAVRSALPAPPAVRSALPLPCEHEPTTTTTMPDEKVGMDDGVDIHGDDGVDIHGFSSAVTGSDIPPRTERSSEEDGMSLPEEEMMFFGQPWLDDGSMNGFSEMRKRGGPGSRATYRCSRCLAPKKGHRCPFETESSSPADAEPKPDQLPAKLQYNKKDPATTTATTTTTSNDVQHHDAGAASPSKSNEASGHEEETSKPEGKGGRVKAAAAAEPVVKEFSVSAKWLLESGVLEGLTVRYMPRAGEVLGSGVVKSGVILCTCRQCKCHQGFNASSFEKHVGSTARHPSDFIYLDNGRRLREVLEDGSRFRDKPNMMNALRKAVSMDWDDAS